MKFKVYVFLSVFIILYACTFLSYSQTQIKDTKHNLSASGPGQYKAMSETRICFFCHTPHTKSPKQPLWNHDLSAVTHYKTYESSTLDAVVLGGSVSSPDGASKLCLGCHDGTVALGALESKIEEIQFGGLVGNLAPSSKAHIGTDLSGSHPVSFMVTEAIIAANNAKDSPLHSMVAMKSDPDVKLDKDNKVQCTSCHSVHNDKNFLSSGIHFWAKPTWNDVCKVCHLF